MAAKRIEGFEEDGDVSGVSDRQDSPTVSDSSEAPGEPDVDRLMDRVDLERRIGMWIRALDHHVNGACRADERMKPLLKLDVSGGVAEDRFMAQLSQHFEAAEVGLLARCLCVPLVSIRVGIVSRQENLLCPTATRGHLNLALLPSSNMSISFIGDDGRTESLAVLSNDFESSQVIFEEISADTSGRSFLVKLPGLKVLYFWCSEKSKLHGMRLLAKLKDLLRKRPSLSHLTGICESRLDSFAIHLRAYLLGSSNASEVGPSASLSEPLVTASSMHATETDAYYQSAASSPHTSQTQSVNQSTLNPGNNTAEHGTTISSSFITSGVREKNNQQGDNSHYSSLLYASNLATSVSTSSSAQHASQCGGLKLTGGDGCSSSPFISQLEMPFPPSAPSYSFPLLLNLPPPPIGASKSLPSPYYCWCPPFPSFLQYSLAPHHQISLDESLPLPPLSSLLSMSATGPSESLAASVLPGDGPENRTIKLPSLLSLPVSSLITMPSSKQIPTFTPYMSDPIVHVPVIDVCSSGQGYLVNAGSSVSSAIPPLLPSFASHPLILSTESPVEKSARETLRMLMASTPLSSAPNLMNVLPSVLNRINENFPCMPMGEHGTTVHGGQGLPGGALGKAAAGGKIGSAEREDHLDADEFSRRLPPGSKGYDDSADDTFPQHSGVQENSRMI